MSNVTPISQRIAFEDLMTTKEVAAFLRKSVPTIRALMKRKNHPLPYIDFSLGKTSQPSFHRPSILRWIEEEIQMNKKKAGNVHVA